MWYTKSLAFKCEELALPNGILLQVQATVTTEKTTDNN